MVSAPLRPHVISVRAGHQEGTGDARRVASLAAAFELAGIDARYSSLIGPTDSLSVLFPGSAGMLRLASLVPRFLTTGLPLQVLLVHKAMSGLDISTGPYELPIYVTSRIVPTNGAQPYAVDFVDSMAENARSSARKGNWLARAFWRIEARRVERWEAMVARRSLVATAVSEDEAKTIGPGVESVPIEVEVEARATSPDRQRSVLFAGSLFYRPNDEAAQWVVRELVPVLVARGWSPSQIVIAGRRPGRKLESVCQEAGVDLRADVPNLLELMRVAGVMVVPLRLGSGVQTKVLHAYACHAPLVMTPRATRGINIPASEEQGVVVLPRDPATWVDAIERLVSRAPSDGGRAGVLKGYRPADVRQRWLQLLLPHLGGP